MSTVEEIMNAVKGLSPHEQAEVRRRLDTLPAPSNENDGAADLDQLVQHALYEAGLVSEIKPPITDPTPYRHEPIKIRGEPLSETVIEERR